MILAQYWVELLLSGTIICIHDQYDGLRQSDSQFSYIRTYSSEMCMTEACVTDGWNGQLEHVCLK